MKNRGSIAQCVRGVLRDDSGQAMTEYAVLMLVICTLCFWLYHPDNGFYFAAKLHFDTTALMLAMPGP